MRTSGHPRAILDLTVTVLMGCAAAVLLWKLLATGPATVAAPQRRPPVEDVQSARVSTDISSIPVRGSDSAAVVLIEFADFQCPFCGRYASETFDQIEKDFVSSGLVQYAVRNLPLPNVHQFAVPAAQAAICAGDQGAFWEMRAHLYSNQDKFGESVWFKWNESLINIDALRDCVDQSDLSRIEADRIEASRLGITSTPTFLIGRRTTRRTFDLVTRINGALPYAAFRDALNHVLKM